MKTHIRAAWKPLAALGLALALAGCNNNNGGGGLTGGGASGSGEAIATVGGTTITRADLTKILEAQSGAQFLPVLIDTQLLIQAGKDAGITVTDAEIAAELERQKKLDPRLGEELTKNPLLTDVINTQVRRNIVSQRLLTKDVKMTDADVQKFFTTYKSYYEAPAQIKFGRLLTSTQARADAMSRALKAKSKTFKQLVEEQKKTQDQAAVDSNETTGDFLPLDVLPLLVGPNDAKAIEKLPVGGITSPLKIQAPGGQTVYAIYQITERKEPTKADFAALKETVETDYKMAQVAMEEVKKNPENPPFDETLQRTRDAVRAQSQDPTAAPPSMRDVLTLILRPRQQNILTELRTKGTVQINDPAYKTVADEYKPVPTPTPPAAGAADAATAGASTAGAPAANSAAPTTNAPPVAPAPAPATDAPAAP